jgi:transglutaminase-like putative cysteine protease
VKDFARKAVGKEKDPWKKALLIEKWVHFNMRGTNKEALAPADEVARTLEGDCTEYAMLMAAMCRAEGVPSRTAIGLIYADSKAGPVMAFHMWTEVWVQDQWVPLDATLGRGYVGATHLKITDHSWHDTRSLTPLLPLIRILGKVQIEVVSAQ